MKSFVKTKPWELIEPNNNLLTWNSWGYYQPAFVKKLLENKEFFFTLNTAFGFSSKEEAQKAAQKHKETFLELLDTKITVYRNVVKKLENYKATLLKNIILETKTDGFVFKTEKFGQFFYYLKSGQNYFISKAGFTHRSDATRMFNMFAVRILKGHVTEIELNVFHKKITKLNLDRLLTYHNRNVKK